LALAEFGFVSGFAAMKKVRRCPVSWGKFGVVEMSKNLKVII
jgi:hypothetical protein